MTKSSIDPRLRGARCRCSACGHVFRSAGAFTKHRVGKPDARRCLTIDEMTSLEMTTSDDGTWRGKAMTSKALAWVSSA